MERRNKPTTTSTGSSVADFADGWPPSSIPPEPSSPSPTVDFQVIIKDVFVELKICGGKSKKRSLNRSVFLSSECVMFSGTTRR